MSATRACVRMRASVFFGVLVRNKVPMRRVHVVYNSLLKDNSSYSSHRAHIAASRVTSILYQQPSLVPHTVLTLPLLLPHIHHGDLGVPMPSSVALPFHFQKFHGPLHLHHCRGCIEPESQEF
jgi:hypothetical protein